MAIEIERKFLVTRTPWSTAHIPADITQGYISLDSGRTVRVRTEFKPGFTKATITIKGEPVDISRTEFEYEIPFGDALQMLENGMCLAKIKKRRYTLIHDSKIWTVDQFMDHNHPLILAEIELANVKEAWNRPDWLGEEVTHNPQYYNSSMALKSLTWQSK